MSIDYGNPCLALRMLAALTLANVYAGHAKLKGGRNLAPELMALTGLAKSEESDGNDVPAYIHEIVYELTGQRFEPAAEPSEPDGPARGMSIAYVLLFIDQATGRTKRVGIYSERMPTGISDESCTVLLSVDDDSYGAAQRRLAIWLTNSAATRWLRDLGLWPHAEEIES